MIGVFHTILCKRHGKNSKNVGYRALLPVKNALMLLKVSSLVGINNPVTNISG
jgi:hypothetical protein